MSIARQTFVMNPPRGRLGWGAAWIWGGLGATFLAWSADGAQINLRNLAGGVPYMWDFLTRMLPPNWAFIERLWAPALESLQVAVWGTILGVA
ncbi:MAG: phosphonate ABC transporter, permease protein PhnE, partial [Alphaproteobacteria bacterium]|nr:phosphonate ABC transporter, permease protein PhnE [Alphaproteobacteria bacterium]